MRRFRSSISEPFSLLPEKHAPAMFQQRRNLFFFMSQFCNRLHVTMAHDTEIWREMGRTVVRSFVEPIYRSSPDPRWVVKRKCRAKVHPGAPSKHKRGGRP